MFDFLIDLKKQYKKYLSSITEDEQKKITSYLYLVLTLFTVSFLGLFAIGPTLNTVSNLNKQYDDNKLVYNSLHQKFVNLQLLDAQYATIQSDLEQIYSAIPKRSDIPKLTRQIENLAALNNLRVSEFSVGTIEIFPNIKRDSIYSFNFILGVLGSEKNINNFIADVISFDRIVGIDNIATGRNQETEYTLSFTGRVYFSPK